MPAYSTLLSYHEAPSVHSQSPRNVSSTRRSKNDRRHSNIHSLPSSRRPSSQSKKSEDIKGPSWYGYVRDVLDSLILIQSFIRGEIAGIHKRLNKTDSSRYIQSGAVFVFREEDSDIKRWTEGGSFKWTPSRVMGEFLVYREILEEIQRHLHNSQQAAAEVNDEDLATMDEAQKFLRTLVVSLKDGSMTEKGVVRPGGLVKRTFTLHVAPNVNYHVISYYTPEDVLSGLLTTPSAHPQFEGVAESLDSELLEPSNFRRAAPQVARDATGRLHYLGENPNLPDTRQHAPPMSDFLASLATLASPLPPPYYHHDQQEEDPPSSPSEDTLDLQPPSWPTNSIAPNTISVYPAEPDVYADLYPAFEHESNPTPSIIAPRPSHPSHHSSLYSRPERFNSDATDFSALPLFLDTSSSAWSDNSSPPLSANPTLHDEFSPYSLMMYPTSAQGMLHSNFLQQQQDNYQNAVSTGTISPAQLAHHSNASGYFDGIDYPSEDQKPF